MRQAWAIFLAALGCFAAEARERAETFDKEPAVFKEKRCCGYPLGEFKLSFYWLAYESDYVAEAYDTTIFSPEGWPIGTFPERFVAEMSLEGSAVLQDGRVLNYGGHCGYGRGICFVVVDTNQHPVGIGVRQRALVPYRSVAVDPKVIAIGEPLYFPELDGIALPDGSLHDGCVRADDQGGAIRKREIDFFVLSHDEFRQIGEALSWSMRVTPTVEEPRCQYLSDGFLVPPLPPVRTVR